MRRNPPTMEAEAQQILDQLWSEKLIPFALNVGKITKAPGEYTIHFHDSRIRTVSVPFNSSDEFSNLVRSAVLDRVARISGPLRKLRTKP